MARVNKAKKKRAHNYLIEQEQKSLAKKDVKTLKRQSVVSEVSEVKMTKNTESRESRRDKIARKKRETKRRKAPNQQSMDIDKTTKTSLSVKKTTGIHKK